ncbi:MAG: hypothetical protein WDO18_17355 [Acidobacteriota bacterium]
MIASALHDHSRRKSRPFVKAQLCRTARRAH